MINWFLFYTNRLKGEQVEHDYIQNASWYSSITQQIESAGFLIECRKGMIQVPEWLLSSSCMRSTKKIRYLEDITHLKVMES